MFGVEVVVDDVSHITDILLLHIRVTRQIEPCFTISFVVVPSCNLCKRNELCFA